MWDCYFILFNLLYHYLKIYITCCFLLICMYRRCRRTVPCQILTLDVTAWYKVLFSAKWMMSTPLLSKHLPNHPRNVCLCLPLSLFPSTFPATIQHSMPPFLTMCPKKLHCLFTICFINCHSVWAPLNTSSFVTRQITELSTSLNW